MGRPRKPTSLKILDGDRPDRINRAEPAAPPGIGDPPAWLDRFGKEAWTRLVEHHRTSLLLTTLDAELITLYCQSYSTYRHALASITRHVARTVQFGDEPGANDDPDPEKPHPMMRVVNASHRQMTSILAKFGMSPSDRAGLHIEARPEADELLSYLAPAPTDGKAKAPKRGN